MYQCLNCGGGLKFDIPSQKMYCDNCQSYFDPYSLDENLYNGAEQADFYDVNTFTCGHCGGEIYSTDNSVTENCTFCGASTLLKSRMTQAKIPDYIIPFNVTKEQCKEAYKKFVGRSFFAPKEFKNPKYLNNFRGIYMPYWTYNIEQNGECCLNGEQIVDNGDYISSNTYKLRFNIDNFYNGLPYDASSSFYDSISSAIAPFQIKQMDRFHPAILSGFYAEAADIPSSLYINDAKDYCNNATLNSLSDDYIYRNINITMPDSLPERNASFHTTLTGTKSAMFPVWFMSYRKGKRVAYAVVNGQTGKTTADFPISVGKYILCSLLIAIPIFCILYMFAKLSPNTTLVITSLIACVSSIIYGIEITEIAKKDTMADDRGYMLKQHKSAYKVTKTHKIRKPIQIGTGILLIIAITVYVGLTIILPEINTIAISTKLKAVILSPLTQAIVISTALTGTITASVIGTKVPRQLKYKTKAPGFVLSIIAVTLSLAVTIINPETMLIYQGVILISLIMVLCLNLNIIFKYNELATRKLPQLDTKGGKKNV